MYDLTFKSPNFGYPKGSAGRNGHKILGVGIHISGAEWQSNYNHIMNSGANASYNAIIQRDGKIVSLVPESNAAYSHGKILKPNWPLLRPGVNPNLYTLSLARVGSNQNTWEPAQLDSTVKVILAWAEKYNFAPEWPAVFGHRHIDSVGRWFCPGQPFLDALYVRLKAATNKPTPGVTFVPKILRQMPIERDGKREKDYGLLVDTGVGIKTFVEAAYIGPMPPSDITGHGDHIKITTRR